MISVLELNWKIKNRGNGIRVGQELFNSLFNAGVIGIENCRGTAWDPFYTVDDMPEYASWMNHHAVIQNDKVVEVRALLYA